MTRSMKSAWFFVLGLFGLHWGSAFAASDVLCVDGVTGESTFTAGCIDVQSWSWGGTNTGGSPNLANFSFTKSSDSSSDDLFGFMVAGASIKGNVTLSEYQSCCSSAPYLTIQLTGAKVTSFQTSNSSGGGKATESVSMSYVSVNFCYSPTVNNVVGTPQCVTYP